MEKPKEELTDEEIFVPDEGDAWSAKPLTLKNSIRFIRLLSEVVAKAMLMMDVDLFVDDRLTEEGLMELLALLDAPTIRLLLSIITGLKPETVEETFGLEKALDVIIEFVEQENLANIWGKVRGLARSQEFQERTLRATG